MINLQPYSPRKTREGPNKIRNEGEVTANTIGIRRIIRHSIQTIICQPIGQPRINGIICRNNTTFQDWTKKKQKNLNRLITSNDTEKIIKKLPQKTKIQDLVGSHVNSTNIKEKLISILLKPLQKTEDEGTFPNLLYEANITYTQTRHYRK